MKKYFVTLVLLFCGIVLSAGNIPVENKLFDDTVKYVDKGGEMFNYQDTAGLQKLINKIIPALLDLATQNDPVNGQLIKSGAGSLINLININAIRATAESSMQVTKGIYRTKYFINADMKARSILIDPTVRNVKQNFLDLPADTLVALKFRMNLGRIWRLIIDEIKNSKDPQINALAMLIPMLKSAENIDIDAIMNGIEGDLELLIAGVSPETFRFKLILPDKNGQLAALIQKFMVFDKATKSAIVPLTENFKAQLICLSGQLALISSPDALKESAATLSTVGDINKYTQYLPADGCGYMIVSVSESLLNNIKKEFSTELPPALLDALKPFSMVAIERATPDGISSCFLSDFSIAQLHQQISFCSAFLPPLLSSMPALNIFQEFLPGFSGEDADAPAASTSAVPGKNAAKSRQKDTSLGCINDMKTLGYGLIIYADNHADNFPEKLQILLERGEITEEILEKTIYLGHKTNLKKINNPAVWPAAFCGRYDHADNIVHVLFSDGHTEEFTINADADEEDVIDLLHKKYNYAPEKLKILKKSIEEY